MVLGSMRERKKTKEHKDRRRATEGREEFAEWLAFEEAESFVGGAELGRIFVEDDGDGHVL